MASYLCDFCKKLNIAHVTFDDWEGEIDFSPDRINDFLNSVGNELEWLPVSVADQDFPDVPRHIAEAASEAHKSIEICAYRACVLLSRAVVEATAKECGIDRGTLASKIDKMFEQGRIREYVKAGAHEVRYLGNEMAHGDFVNPVSVEDASLILTLMNEILEEVFQAPARVERARAARAAKTAAPQIQP